MHKHPFPLAMDKYQERLGPISYQTMRNTILQPDYEKYNSEFKNFQLWSK